MLLMILLSFAAPAAAKPSSPEVGERLLLVSVRQLLLSQPFPHYANKPESPEAKRLDALSDELVARYRWLEDTVALPGSISPLTAAESEELVRLLKAEPDWMDRWGVFLPRRPDVMEWAASQYSGAESAPEWLIANYPGFRAGLVERAAMGGEISLTALAILDWPTAEPIINRMLQGKDYIPALRVMLYHPGSAERARRELLTIVHDPEAELFDRAWAAEGLLLQDWEGADQLFLSMLEDPVWHSEHLSTIDPFETFVRKHPEWQSRLLSMVGDPRPTVRRNAILALSELLEGDSPNADLIRALLPWLSDPSWAEDSGFARSSLIEATTKSSVPETVPGLLHVLRTGSDADALNAATALERYNPPGFREAWEASIGQATTYGDSLAEVGIRQGWFTLNDQVDAVAQETLGNNQIDPDRADPKIVIREHLASACIYGEPRPDLTAALTELGRKWYQNDQPRLAELENELLDLPGAAVDSYMLERLSRGDVSSEFLRVLLSRRKSIKATNAPALNQLVSAGGPRAGIALALLGNETAANTALSKAETPTALALLAATRVIGMSLAPPSLEAAAARPELREAVLAYLRTSEDKQHLALLNQLGDGYQISGRSTGESWIEKAETEIVARYHERGKPELYVLQSHHEGHSIYLAGTELWVDGDQAELLFEDNKLAHIRRGEDAPSYERRVLDSEELAAFQAFIRDRDVDNWTQWDNVTSHHFTSFQYLHLTPEGGRRVGATFNSGTDQGEGEKYEDLVDLFTDLKKKPSQTVYQIQKEMPGVRVLEDNSQAVAICTDEEGLKVREEDWQHNVSWRLLTKQGLGAPSKPAKDYPEDPPPDTFTFTPISLANGLFLDKSPNRLVVRRPNEREKTFLKGSYSSPALDSERRQGLVLKWEDKERNRWTYELVDFVDGTVRPVQLPPGIKAFPTAYLPGKRAFLAVAGESYDRLEKTGYLVDAKSGKVTPVSGEFRPWLQSGERPLQKAGGTRYWAAMRTDLGTEVGTIDEQTFEFEPVAHYPTLRFNASQMWVDGDQVYVAIGDILVLPLNPK